jgi:hypothetical protein
MDLGDVTRKKLEAVQFILNYPDAFGAASSPFPGVGITASPDNRENYQLLFHVASESERQLIGDLYSELNIQGEPVIEVTGQAFSLPGSSLLERIRPLSVGASISPGNSQGITAGTLGCFVRKEADAEALYLLSCTHVLAPLAENISGEPIFQPERSGSINNQIASLNEYIPLTPYSTDSTIIALDAAIAKVTCPETLNYAQNPNTSIVIKGHYAEETLPALGGSSVIKIGSTSQRTVGVIQGSGLRLTLRYTYPNSLQTFYCCYQNLISIKSKEPGVPFCRKGDSGSLLHDQDGYAVGLIIGGVESENIGYALPIEPILTRLGIQLILSE